MSNTGDGPGLPPSAPTCGAPGPESVCDGGVPVEIITARDVPSAARAR